MMKFLLVLFAGFLLFPLLRAEQSIYAQPLLSQEEQRKRGFEHPMPAQDVARAERISNEASKKGWEFLKDQNLLVAMQEFNRAWRYNPLNYQAFWGCGVVYSILGTQNTPRQEEYLKGAETLIESSLALASDLLKEDVKPDLGAVYNQIGIWAQKRKDEPQAQAYFNKARKVLEPLRSSASSKGRVHSLLAATYFHQGDLEAARKEAKLAAENGVNLTESFRKELESGKKAE